MSHICIDNWKHVFKLDPDREISDEALDKLCLSGTDAIMVGGSTGVTYGNTVDLLSRIRRYDVPCVLEVSDREAVVPGFDLYLIPVVLNAGETDWIVGKQHEAIRRFGGIVPWEMVAAEAYIVLNADSAVGRLTGANARLDTKDVAAYAAMAEKLFRFPIFYMEYSGMFGDMDLVRRTADMLEETRLFYGGGISGKERALLAAEAADTIVVGNIIYERLDAALETVVGKAGAN